MKKINYIVRKAYIPPYVLFEDVEQDERDFMMAGSPDSSSQGGSENGGGDESEEFSGLELSFGTEQVDNSADFIIADEF